MNQRGFTYVAVLLLVAILSLGLAVAGPQWAQAQQQDREDELLRIGVLYAQAIASYYESSPGSLKHYPPSFEALLLDGRYAGVRRHLRRLYSDPMVPGHSLAPIVGEDGTLRGVRSTSEQVPYRHTVMRFDRVVDIPPAYQYRQWAFLAAPKT